MLHILRSSSLILALTVAGASATVAQTAQSPNQTTAPTATQTPGGQHREFHHRGANPEFEARMLTKRLNLSAEQAAQIEPILAAEHESMKALRPAQGAAQPDFNAMREQHKAIMDDTKARIDAVLTPEQREQFAKMHEHKFHGQGPHGDWTPRTSAPAPTA